MRVRRRTPRVQSVRRIIWVAGLFALAITQAGCSLTTSMWTRATERTLYYDRVDGILRTPGGPDTGACMVLQYSIPDGSPAYMAIPLDAAGSPIAPFSYSAQGATADEIRAAVPTTRSAPVGEYLFGDDAAAMAKRARRSAGYEAFAPVSEHYEVQNCVGATGRDSRVLLVMLGSDGKPLDKNDAKPDGPLPQGCRLVLLPSTQPRPEGERKQAIFGATLLTPLTLVADVVIFPYVLVVVMAAGR